MAVPSSRARYASRTRPAMRVATRSASLPNANHPGVSSNPYFIRRKLDFFLRHLVGAEPPHEYKLKGPGA